jgi:hypothetical protein
MLNDIINIEKYISDNIDKKEDYKDDIFKYHKITFF